MNWFVLFSSIAFIMLAIVDPAHAQKSKHIRFCEKILSSYYKEKPTEPRRLESRFVKDLFRKYPQVLELTNDPRPHVANGERDLENSPSLLLKSNLQKRQYDEFDRTIVGVLAMKWVLNDDYESFVSKQPEAVRLTRKSFNEFRELAGRIIKTPEDLEAMIVYMLINDIGKINSITNRVKEKIEAELAATFSEEKRNALERTKTEIFADHDRILLYALENYPEIAGRYQKLAPRYRALILESLRPQLNFGQFVQAENTMANWMALKGMSKLALDYYLLHLLFDLSGAHGQFTALSAKLMIEPMWQRFSLVARMAAQIGDGVEVQDVFHKHFRLRAQMVGLPYKTVTDRALTYIACMLGASNTNIAQNIVNAFKNLPANVQAILTRELNVTGINDGTAFIRYYAPQFLNNIITDLNGSKDQAAYIRGVEIGLSTLARAFQQLRIEVAAENRGNGILTLHLDELASLVKNNPQGKWIEILSHKAFKFDQTGENDFEIKLVNFPKLESETFPQMKSLAEIDGNAVALIGGGGGGDAVTAAQLGHLIKPTKKVSCLISVRRAKAESPGSSEITGQNRMLINHRGEIFPGVFLVGPETAEASGGRFFENLFADEFPTYVVIDSRDDRRLEQIQAAVKHAGGADTLVQIDTGGDIIYRAKNEEVQAIATPDQDHEVLESLGKILHANVYVAVVAPGVDTPEYGKEILQNAKARYFRPDADQAQIVLGNHRRWKMDQPNQTNYSKTSLAWNASLIDPSVGVQSLALPASVVERSLWNPFVHITSDMQGIFIMKAGNLLQAIAMPIPEKSPKNLYLELDQMRDRNAKAAELARRIGWEYLGARDINYDDEHYFGDTAKYGFKSPKGDQFWAHYAAGLNRFIEQVEKNGAPDGITTYGKHSIIRPTWRLPVNVLAEILKADGRISNADIALFSIESILSILTKRSFVDMENLVKIVSFLSQQEIKNYFQEGTPLLQDLYVKPYLRTHLVENNDLATWILVQYPDLRAVAAKIDESNWTDIVEEQRKLHPELLLVRFLTAMRFDYDTKIKRK